MIDVNRVEIIVSAAGTKRVLKLLKEHGIEHYTIIKNASGHGETFERDGAGLTDAFSINYILVACQPEIFESMKEPLRALIAQNGGTCLVSKAHWLNH